MVARNERSGGAGESLDDVDEDERFSAETPEEHETKVDIWLISFTDVMALMLTFFVLLYAMAEPESRVWSQMVMSIQDEFNISLSALRNPGFEEGKEVGRKEDNRALDLNYLSALIERLMENYSELEELRVEGRGDSIIISIPSDMLFASGSAELIPDGRKALFVISGTLSNISNAIEIYGHTDPRPVTGGEFVSNWDLSLARAASVAALLKESGYRRDVVVQGLADRDFDLINPALDLVERQNLARRVEVVVRSGRSDLEEQTRE